MRARNIRWVDCPESPSKFWFSPMCCLKALLSWKMPFFLTQNCHNFLFIETNPPYGEITWSMLTKGIYFLNIPLFGLNFMYVPKIKKANFKWKMAFSFKRKVLEGSTKNRIRLLKFWLTPFVGSEHQNLGVSQALER